MSLARCPDEIIQHVLLFLPPEDNLRAFQLVSRRMSRVARDPHLWRHHCRLRFRYWDSSHALARKLADGASAADWMGLFVARLRKNVTAARLLDDVIEASSEHAPGFGKLAQMGDDVRDYLLEQAQVGDEYDDVLARRFYSNAILASIRRGAAIEEWAQLQRIYSLGPTPLSSNPSSYAHSEPGIRLERLLGAFDHFVLGSNDSDIDNLSRLLDRLASSFRADTPHLADLPTRQKALALNRWLRSANVVGMDDPDRNYRNLGNCFIGWALSGDGHNSLPIVSCAIYCCIAERINLDANCCLFPLHVHVVVSPNPGETLDGPLGENTTTPAAAAPAVQHMYLDPYSRDDEVQLSEMQHRLAASRLAPSPQFFCPAPPSLVARRAASNIHAAYEHLIRVHIPLPTPLRRHGPVESFEEEDLLAAQYAARWAHTVTSIPGHFETLEWQRSAHSLVISAKTMFYGDYWLVEKYLVPMHERHTLMTQGIRPASHSLIQMVHNPYPSPCVRQTTAARQSGPLEAKASSSASKFRVGQPVWHLPDSFFGIITRCISKSTITCPGSNKGRKIHTAFYTILRTLPVNSSIVAHDNIQLVKDHRAVPDDLIAAAGRYFLRFDRASCTFVPNLGRIPLDG